MNSATPTQSDTAGFDLGIRFISAKVWLAPQFLRASDLPALLILHHYCTSLLQEHGQLVGKDSILGSGIGDGGCIFTVRDPRKAATLLIDSLPPALRTELFVVAYWDRDELAWRTLHGTSPVPIDELFSAAAFQQAIDALRRAQRRGQPPSRLGRLTRIIVGCIRSIPQMVCHVINELPAEIQRRKRARQ